MSKLIVNFTEVSPAPAYGYRVRFKKSNAEEYVTFSPNPTSSPFTIDNLENGYSYDVIIESDCDVEQYSSSVFVTANPTKDFSSCPANLSGINSSNDYYMYPSDYIDLYNNPTLEMSLSYVSYGRPNRFTVYDESGNLVESSGWVGSASWEGPWGSSLNTPTTGSFTFDRDPGSTYYRVFVEAGPGNPSSPASNSWNASFVCL